MSETELDIETEREIDRVIERQIEREREKGLGATELSCVSFF